MELRLLEITHCYLYDDEYRRHKRQPVLQYQTEAGWVDVPLVRQEVKHYQEPKNPLDHEPKSS